MKLQSVSSLLLWACFSVAACGQDVADDYIPADGNEQTAAADTENPSGWDYDWSGSYFGLSAGYAIGQHDTLGVGGIDSGSRDLSGSTYSAQMGQNYHLTRIVLGTETDFTKAQINGPFTLPGSALACGSKAFNCTTDVDWYGTFRARAGFAFGDFLPYATAGIAVGGVNSRFKGSAFESNVGGLGVGWVLGAGLEYAVMKNLTLRGEVLHFDLADVSSTIIGNNVSADTNFTVIRTGINLKF